MCDYSVYECVYILCMVYILYKRRGKREGRGV